ncbi:MAG: hypothetical protein AB2693_31815, partial [Candidatus Thiodiazotropha sp.]
MGTLEKQPRPNNQQYADLKILNLSKRELTTAEISILEKGMKFTPTPEKQNLQEIKEDMAEFNRKIRLKEFFYEQEDEDDSLVKNRSDFTPPKGRNEALEKYISTTSNFPLSTAKSKTHYNISLQQRNVLKKLSEDKEIIIKEADKGGAIVIMDSYFYQERIQLMLNDKTFYKEITEKEIKNTMKKVLRFINNQECLTKKENDYLCNFEVKHSNFYGLPKIHKSSKIKEACQSGEKLNYVKIEPPENLLFRPIVAGPSCETHRLSNLVDILLKPYVSHIDSYIRDSLDFLNYLPETVEDGTLLVSFDIVNLYSNISHSLGLEAMEHWLNKYPAKIHRRFSKTFILEAIKLILENNNFYFNGKYYQQIKGTAMGTKCAPTYATLVLGYLEQILYRNIQTQYGNELYIYIEANWKRFLDDCFTFWTKSKSELCLFHSMLNNLHPDIKFTIDCSTNELPFLDILIRKNKTNIETDIFYKPTDSKQYLDFNSCHPNHTKRSIPYNLARRICTIVSDRATRDIRLGELKQYLRERHYPVDLIENSIQKVVNIDLKTLRTQRVNEESDEILPYVSTHNPKNPEAFQILRNNLPILTNDQQMSKVLKDTKIIKSKRQPQNLKKLLTKAKFDSKKTEIKTVTKCKRPNCGLCVHITEGNYYDFHSKRFFINESMSCDV